MIYQAREPRSPILALSFDAVWDDLSVGILMSVSVHQYTHLDL